MNQAKTESWEAELRNIQAAVPAMLVDSTTSVPLLLGSYIAGLELHDSDAL